LLTGRFLNFESPWKKDLEFEGPDFLRRRKNSPVPNNRKVKIQRTETMACVEWPEFPWDITDDCVLGGVSDCSPAKLDVPELVGTTLRCKVVLSCGVEIKLIVAAD
jgi:hypothetical protein